MWEFLIAVDRELIMFAVFGFMIGGSDDLAIDLIWLGRAAWRQFAVYTVHDRVDTQSLAIPQAPGRLVIFIAAWREDDVISAMLSHAIRAWAGHDYRIYVGVYPNDWSTQAAVRPFVGRKLKMVVCAKPGPTTKADCLNNLWLALRKDERRQGRVKAVILHDAEDVVHSGELRVFDTLIERFALVQLPVLPLVDQTSRWVSGHYNDEFAEAHGKTIVVREALGAGIPSAGVGSAFAREMLGAIADSRGGVPFDEDSLTEDYELSGARHKPSYVQRRVMRSRRRIAAAVLSFSWFPLHITPQSFRTNLGLHG